MALTTRDASSSAASPSRSSSSSSTRRNSNSSSNSLLHRRVASRVSTSTASSSLSPSPPSSYDMCESYLRLKKRSALTWSTRFAVLRGAELYVFYSKQDAALRRNLVDALSVASGRIAPRADLALELRAADGREFQARAFSRGDLARWVTAFHRLAVRREAAEAASASAIVGTTDAAAATSTKRLRVDADGSVGSPARSEQSDASGERRCGRSSAFEASDALQQQQQSDENQLGAEEEEEEERNPVVLAPARTSDAVAGSGTGADTGDREPNTPNRRRRRRVSFNGSVMVRLIPTLEQAQVPELFYSKQEVERFSAQATSLLSRTEEAVSCACLALRRGPTTLLPWRRQTV